MVHIAPATRQNHLAALLLTLTTLLISACGLGMDAQSRIERGQKALEQGEYRAAIIDAKNVLLEEPGNVAGRLLLGRASVEIRDGVSGEKELRRAIDLGIPLSDVAVALGRAMLLQARFDEFITEITPELIAEHTDRLLLIRLRGYAMLGLQQPVVARELFTEVLAADRDDMEAQLGVVQSYIAEQNFSQARETLNQVLSFSDKYVNAWLASGSAMGQSAYFSMEGDFNVAADQHDFLVDLSRTVGTPEDLRFVTYANGGGTNAAGDTIAAGGIDSVLELFDSLNAQRGFDDDGRFGLAGLDSLLSWPGVAVSVFGNVPLNPDPLLVDSYHAATQSAHTPTTTKWTYIQSPGQGVTHSNP